MRHFLALLVLLFLTPRPVSAASMWAAWDLEPLDGLAPPTSFLLTLTSPSVSPAPLTLTVPATACTAVPEAQYCMQLGCPPDGSMAVTVQAQYAEGLSEVSEAWTCTVRGPACLCETGPPPPPPPARPVVAGRFCQRQGGRLGVPADAGGLLAASPPRSGFA